MAQIASAWARYDADLPIPLRAIAAVALATMLVAPVVLARKSKSIIDQAVEAYQSTNSTTLPAAGTIEVAFSPNEGSEHLVVKVIDSAKTELDLLSCSLTSVPVVEALVRARHRGVTVRLVTPRLMFAASSLCRDRIGIPSHPAITLGHGLDTEMKKGLGISAVELRITCLGIWQERAIFPRFEGKRTTSVRYTEADFVARRPQRGDSRRLL